MRRRRLDTEDRREQHYRRLGTHTPQCATCPETDPRCLQKHHIAGRKYDKAIALACANCHSKLSDDQLDHPPHRPNAPIDQQTIIGRFLLGLCDLLLKIVQTLREFAHWLLNQPSHADAVP